MITGLKTANGDRRWLAYIAWRISIRNPEGRKSHEKFRTKGR